LIFQDGYLTVYLYSEKSLTSVVKKNKLSGEVAHILCFAEESVLDSLDCIQQTQCRSQYRASIFLSGFRGRGLWSCVFANIWSAWSTLFARYFNFYFSK